MSRNASCVRGRGFQLQALGQNAPATVPPPLDRQALPLNRQGREDLVSQDINVLALVKGSERYIFLFNDGNRAETLRTLGRYASNPELSFSWYDAAVLSQKIRQTAKADPPLYNRNSLPQPSDPYNWDDIA